LYPCSVPCIPHSFPTRRSSDLHSDHNADYGNLIWLAWSAGLRRRVDTWGPPPLAKMTRLFFELNEYDIHTRIADEGRVPLEPLVDRKSTRLNSSHVAISYAVFC